MALRDQPYIPLYVQDFLTDEKLCECSAESTGVYIRLMCIMHKSKAYGKILLSEKQKTTSNTVRNFAKKLVRQMPYDEATIERALDDLIENEVITLDGDTLYQKRMVKDADISEKRAEAGSKGGKSVKNSHTKRLYNEPGYIYLLADVNDENCFKIGISKDPEKRLTQLQYKTGKTLRIIHVEACTDMGNVEDSILEALSDHRDGEWIYGLNESKLIEKIKEKNKSKTEAKPRANSEIEIEYETESEDVSEDDSEKERKPRRKNPSTLSKAQELRFNRFWAVYPRKVSIGDAEKAWAKISPDEELTDTIIAAVDTAKRCDSRFREIKYTPHPATWLNARSWENQYNGPEESSASNQRGGVNSGVSSGHTGTDFKPSTGFKLKADDE